jgi:hypothetical protein
MIDIGTTINITKSQVLHRSGTDIVYLHTNLPTTIVGGERHVILSFELRRNTAEQWLLDNFGVEPDSVVSMS